MDTLRDWLGECSTPSIAPERRPEEVQVKEWSTAAEDEAYHWQWEAPDLTKGGEWYHARVASLKEAIDGRKDQEHLLREGLAALDIHRGNYSDAGPKHLQLLWWEFPKEHHEALREGCRIEFSDHS